MTTPTNLDDITLKSVVGDGTIEYFWHNPRSKSGMQTWEVKIKMPDGKRKIMLVRDSGFYIKTKEVKVNSFNSREERNREINRLYRECGLSQMFLSNLFNISQPSVSLIINGKV